MSSIFESASRKQREDYFRYLKAMSSLSTVFSESEIPYLDYRVVENVYCKAFGAENLARSCIAVDARLREKGVGLKTFVETTQTQKIAEFDKLRQILNTGDPVKDMQEVARLRNERMDFAADSYAITDFSYHLVIRRKGALSIHECPMYRIDPDSLRMLDYDSKGFKFRDRSTDTVYRFYRPKSTLLETFDISKPLWEDSIEMLDDPYEAAVRMFGESNKAEPVPAETLTVPLFSFREGGEVPEKSGLNQWNAGGRARDLDEVYIPYVKKVRKEGFFPGRDTPFDLELPNGKHMSAKICQDDGKAIMSNPNKELGEWLLRDVLKLPEGQLVTRRILDEKGANAVVFTKHSDTEYSVDFTYEDPEFFMKDGNPNLDDY